MRSVLWAAWYRAAILLSLTGTGVRPIVLAGDIHPALFNHQRSTSSLVQRTDGVPVDGVPCLIETRDPAALSRAGLALGRPSGRFVTARVPPERIAGLATLDGVIAAYPSDPVEPLLDVSRADSREGALYLGINSEVVHAMGNAGQGVLVGIVDSGIDWDHRDFLVDATEIGNATRTRILFLWDQTLVYPEPYETVPEPFGYGVEYDEAYINLALVPSPMQTYLQTSDLTGHGTHVAGIAAGDGSATDGDPVGAKYRGIAPQAKLVIVKTSFTAAAVIDAVDYIFAKADALRLPCVVNLSLGHQFGSHDGRQPAGLGEQLSSRVGPGRLICAAMGNERGSGRHIETTVVAEATLAWQQVSVLNSVNVELTVLELWHHKDDAFTVQVRVPNGQVSGAVVSGATGTSLVDGHSVRVMNAYGPTMVQSDGDKSIRIEVEVYSRTKLAAGTWQLELTRTTSGGSGAVDAWFGLSGYGSAWSAGGTIDDELVSSPASGDKIIAVASHVTKRTWVSASGSSITCCTGEFLGTIASTSSHGPLRRESASNPNPLLRPDVSAPGLTIASSWASNVAVNPDTVVDDGRHRTLSGTSMACPHVAGALALALRLAPTLTVEQLRTMLADEHAGAARRDAETGGVPGTDFGYGKISAYGLILPFLPTAVDSWALYP